MNSTKILLVGDVHFPEIKSALATADYKDTAYPADLAKISVPDRLGNVARAISRLRANDDSIAGILLCGDLTSRGALAGYQDCVRFLDKAIQLFDPKVWHKEQVHVVPGNHDVDRSLCGKSPDVFKKFKPLVDAWKGPPVRICTSKDYRHSTLAMDGVGVEVFSLNSCVGCGEKRYLPKKVRVALKGMLDKAFKADPKKGFDLVGEQLDTPIFVEQDVSEVVAKINEMDPKRLPIVLAHHNILPQAAPRIAMYTEAINAGLVRSRLTHCSRTVIYCHGHLHTDAIDVVHTPSGNGSRMVSLSVPQLVDGFDVLEVHFGKKGLPLGCTVHRYRVQSDGGVLYVKGSETRVSVHADNIQEYVDQCMLTILRILEYGKFVRLGDLTKRIRLKTKNKTLAEAAIASYFLEAEWLGILTILNREDDPKLWQVQKTKP